MEKCLGGGLALGLLECRSAHRGTEAKKREKFAPRMCFRVCILLVARKSAARSDTSTGVRLSHFKALRCTVRDS